MHKRTFLPKYHMVFIVAFLLIFVGVACLPVAAGPTSTPIIQVIEVNREVTREVTRIVEVPVTVTPTPTPADTDTPTPTATSADTPTITPTSEPAAITVLTSTQCLFGPDPVYFNRYDILAGSQQTVIGRNQDGSWLFVQGTDHTYPCWVKTGLVKVDSGRLIDTPITSPILLPYITLYPPPQAVSTNRSGNDVTIFWLPIAMSEADYNGYLIEARVCQGGQLVFIPKSYVASFDKNTSMMAVKVTDEPGCLEPSSARIYTIIKTGYSTPKDISWPAWPTPSPTPTLTQAP